MKIHTALSYANNIRYILFYLVCIFFGIEIMNVIRPIVPTIKSKAGRGEDRIVDNSEQQIPTEQ